ncbi:hypothetical protein SAMN05421738_101308 [Algoriella xinjiangensis]|uniref:Lipoprotein n=1 Tax=Algoriella xinjiangensis TaxID=684065 RepID=A0A1I4SPT7_9FLAO|nr:hypothetical protein [Algoriella xinjiangensis]SFM66528.1 hypothetical protein SAMN05421738_101308 [Algoriella xinjiangensis]VDH16232.1 Uncharacterised protein [Algoriella xinjiangensis]
MNKLFTLFISFITLIACQTNTSETIGNQLNGTYCAEIKYSNSKTQKNSTYTLPVVIESNYLTKINWNNGGWLDDSHFKEPEFINQKTSFTDDRGRTFKITILAEGSCD